MGSDALVIHLTLVPYLAAAGELKTKPTQHSVKMMLENGVQPDVLVLRTEHPLNNDIKKKVALFCNVSVSSVIESIDVSTIYEVPIKMCKEKLDETVLEKLNLPLKNKPELSEWKGFLETLKNPERELTIALVGKYVELHDAYKSIAESLLHAGVANKAKVKIKWVHSEPLTEANIADELKDVDGVLIAPGFGHRGIEGKLVAVKYARENNIAFLGICLGMQCAVIEYARNVLNLKNAHSSEMSRRTPYPVIDLMEEQKEVLDMGGTMRLGSYPCTLEKGSNAFEAYGTVDTNERHRHRYEFNNKYLKDFEKAGMKGTGINSDTGLVEIVEIPKHKWFVGVQFHPEYKSTVLTPHPVFVGFIKAALEK